MLPRGHAPDSSYIGSTMGCVDKTKGKVTSTMTSRKNDQNIVPITDKNNEKTFPRGRRALTPDSSYIKRLEE